MYEDTPNLKHTIANKGSMKALQRFIQIEMKEHGCYLANGAWLKGRDNQNQQHGIGFFREVHPLYLNFANAKSSLDGCG